MGDAATDSEEGSRMSTQQTTDAHAEAADDLPAGLSNPARRALLAVGVRRLDQVARLTEAELCRLHGIGPKALDQLQHALDAIGLSFAGEEPAFESSARVPRSGQQIVRSNGVYLCAQTFGDRADPAVLLIAGNSASMLSWEDDFCERLGSRLRFVIRYDHRDTGRSVTYAPGAPEYTLQNLAADAVGLLDAFGLARAHLVGMSMGGAIAQLVALDHPDRVASLTLIATSLVSPRQPDTDLPGMSEELLVNFAARPMPDWSDRTAVIEFMVDSQRLLSGSWPFDEAAVRAALGRVVERSNDIASSMTNHNVMDGGERWRERLGSVTAPALVVHGSEDPVFPPSHGIALAKEIPNAQLLTLERTGHELPRAVWDLVIPAILRHTAGGDPSRPRTSSF